jgi:type IV secretion system protein TrbI
MNIQPTLTIRPGFPVRVIVNKDLVLAPYPTSGAT